MVLNGETHAVPARPVVGPKPQWKDYYHPSKAQHTGEMSFVGGEMLALGYAASQLSKPQRKRQLFVSMDAKLAGIYYSPRTTGQSFQPSRN